MRDMSHDTCGMGAGVARLALSGNKGFDDVRFIVNGTILAARRERTSPRFTVSFTAVKKSSPALSPARNAFQAYTVQYVQL